MQEFSTASVFEDTHGSTGYKWDDSSEFDSSEIDSDEQKLRVRLSDLKRVVSKPDISADSNSKNYYGNHIGSIPKKNFPWQSTPQVVHHMHQMSGSTLANDLSSQFTSPVRTDEKLPSASDNERRSASDQKLKSSAGKSRLSTIQSPRADEQKNAPPIDMSAEERQRQMELNFEGIEPHVETPIKSMNTPTKKQPQPSANQENLEEVENVSGSVKSDTHSDRAIDTSSENEAFVPESPNRTPQRPYFIAGMNGLPERLRNEVMKYVSESVSAGRKVDSQDTGLLAEAVEMNASKELQALKAFLSTSNAGAELLDAFENGHDDIKSSTSDTSSISRIGPETLPNKVLYRKLEMDKVESESKIALENILKNIMLQLELPFSAIPVGISTIARALAQVDYVRDFASRVHEALYNEPMVTANPECLNKMLDIIRR